jgi:hypothetical protein
MNPTTSIAVIVFVTVFITAIGHLAFQFFAYRFPTNKELSVSMTTLLILVTCVVFITNSEKNNYSFDHTEEFKPFQSIGDHVVYSRTVGDHTDFIVVPASK